MADFPLKRVIYGPPGTGKTTRIISDIRAMVAQGVPEAQIGLMSFTKTGSKELADRAGIATRWACTIHSAAYHLTGVHKDQIIGWKQLKEFSKLSGIKVTGKDPNDEDGKAEEGDEYWAIYQLALSRMKGFKDTYLNSARPGTFGQFRFFCEKMEEFKKANGYVDFNDLLYMVGRQNVCPPISVLFVDEAQDLSALQWSVIKLWQETIPTVTVSGDDDQCQPAGTKVLTPNGEVNIEHLKDGDKVVSYSTQRGDFGQRRVKTASRPFEGDLYGVATTKNRSWYTPNHICTVRYREDVITKGLRVLYLMEKDGMFRVGQTKAGRYRKNNSGFLFYPTQRACQEGAEKLWVLDTFETEGEAVAAEQFASYVFGIPQTVFSYSKLGIKCKYGDDIWKILKSSNVDFKSRAIDLLNHFDKQYGLPLIKNKGGALFFKAYACNLDPLLHQVADSDGSYLNWTDFKLSKKKYSGLVYSLEVEKTNTYIADGIYTHNCLFVWGGADPEGMSKWEAENSATRIVLDQSYRVPKIAHKRAERLIKRIRNRVDKVYKPLDKEGVVSFVDESRARITHGEDTLVLYRNHALRKDIEDFLINKGVPYHVDNGRYGAFQSPMLKHILFWQEVCAKGLKLPSKKVEEFEPFFIADVAGALRRMDISDVKHIPWHKAIRSLSYRDGAKLLRYFKLIDREYGFDVTPTVKLSTIHGAKGREADTVVLINDMSKRTAEAYNIDPASEIRTFYVGVTRAKEHLKIINGRNGINL